MQICRPQVYLLLMVVMAVNVLFDLLLPLRIDYAAFQLIAANALAFALMLYALSRWQPAERRGAAVQALALALEGGLLVHLMVLALRVGDHVTTANQLPLVDLWLHRTDLALGLDWLGYWQWVHDRPALHGPMRTLYNELNAATLALVVGLLLLRRLNRTRRFAEAFIICAVISILCGLLVPARGAVATLIADPALYPNFADLPGTYFVAAFDHLRAAEAPVIGGGPLPGLVCFPSLHTGIAVLMVLAARRTPLLVPALAYALPMIATTPIWGGHYFVDVIAGTAMAVSVWALLGRAARRRDDAAAAPAPQPAAA